MYLKTSLADKITAAHWGTYRAVVEDGKLVALRGIQDDVDPSPIAEGMLDTLDAPSRIPQPMVRRGFYKNQAASDHGKRGAEPFVAISWEEAHQLVADEISRIRDNYGNQAIYGGCYGWASAGLFHHAKGQAHRFLTTIGGCTTSRNTYSIAAGEVIVPHILGHDFRYWAFVHGTTWPAIIERTDLMVCFGGMPSKNVQVHNGGTGCHAQRRAMRAAHQNGTKFVNVSPIRADMDADLTPEWLAPVPNTDVAIMLGLAHTLVTENLHDQNFLDTYCVGFARFLPYLLGDTDGLPKSAEWAAHISSLTAEQIRSLARRMAQQRTMVTVSWSLTRQDHGEQPYWLATTLAAMLGQIGLLGGGVGFGYGSENRVGNHSGQLAWAGLEQRENTVKTAIPVARIADMLLNPGQQYEYNGQSYQYPDIQLIYWIGGNPFHHHQDLNRLLRAWQKPQTIIVHEPWWNALAKHADIVLPATTTLERNDICCNPWDSYAFRMEKMVEPYAQAHNDYDIFAGIAKRLGCEEDFTQGRNEEDWLRHLYAMSQRRGTAAGVELPTFDAFWQTGSFMVPPPEAPRVMLEAFRRDPIANPLSTPSGKIEIFSETIASFAYPDCLGHPAWFEPIEWLHGPQAALYPLHLVSNQPKARLHSQLDHGAYSRQHKVRKREPVTIHPEDATPRGLHDGDVVRIFNDRGACLAGVIISDEVRCGVVQIATGAWYDPLEPGKIGSVCKHGNVNVLTLDKGTSSLAQGCSAHTCLVEIERYDGEPPPVSAFTPPDVINVEQFRR